MAVPFGFSIGDFLALAKLIGQVAVELGEVKIPLSPLFSSQLIH
jgi:hypothetical protein